MTKARLLACPSCSRHVRATERACPFCAAALPETFAAAPAPRPPPKRLSRGALYAFGATSITLATACSSGGGTVPPGEAGADAESDVTAVPLYGASADAQPFDARGASDVTVAPLYGASADAGPDVRAVAAYGAAAPDATRD